MGALLSLLSRDQLQHRQEPEHAPPSLPDQPFPALSTTSILARFPVEILLLISSFLTPESTISLSLVSTYYYAILSPHIDLTLDKNPMAKKRLLRLLEIDWPDMMACHACNVLYRWKQAPVICSQHALRSQEHMRGIPLCLDHSHLSMYLSVVEAYIRGYEMGPAYGPPLSELAHSCYGCIYGDQKKQTRHSIQARVVRGKLLLHRTFETPVCLLDSLNLEVNRFRNFGCRHSYEALPAIVMEAIEHQEEIQDCLTERRCWDFIICGDCATDLRVRIKPRDPENINVRVDLWQSLGGRDIEQEDTEVQAMFQPMQRSSRNFDLLPPPTRRLKFVYDGQTQKEWLSAPAPELEVSKARGTWLQLWKWFLYADGTFEYKVPSNKETKDQGRDMVNISILHL